MKVSIITVVYNNAHVIKSAIDSVLSQTYSDIEYIIIDGKSIDGTVAIINSYGNKITKFISELDNGIYDAMNKGLKLATGDIVGILNSDDFYINEFVIEKLVKVFESKDVDSIYADLVYVKANNLDRIVRYYDSSYFHPNKFAYGWMPAHPTFFARREVYLKHGYFKVDYKIAADYELLVRFLFKNSISYCYIPEVLVKMRMGGVSTSWRSVYINTFEQLRACKENGIQTSLVKLFYKYPQKLLGYFKKTKIIS